MKDLLTKKGMLRAATIVITDLLVLLMMVISPTPRTVAKIADAQAGCRLSFADISDTHLRDKPAIVFQTLMNLGLSDMARAKDRLDALVLNGDITEGGTLTQWELLKGVLEKHDVADKIFLVTGNHDNRGPNRDDFNDPENGAKAIFKRYNRSIAGRKVSQMYYTDSVNGYSFIVLGSETDSTDAFLSKKQLQWFASAMKKAAAKGKPIFVFLHQPLNGTHGTPYTFDLNRDADPDEGGIGAQSDQVLKILKKYDNVFYFSGHIHSGFKKEGNPIGAQYASVEFLKNNKGNPITLVSSPMYIFFDITRGGHMELGCGWVTEVYRNKVLLRARNFVTGTWLPAYDETVALV